MVWKIVFWLKSNNKGKKRSIFIEKKPLYLFGKYITHKTSVCRLNAATTVYKQNQRTNTEASVERKLEVGDDLLARLMKPPEKK